VQQEWKTLWSTPMAQTFDRVTDLPALTRLFQLKDDRERIYRAVRKKWLVKGSVGQIVVNPLVKQIREMDTEIRQLEDRFGLTPMSRLKLGVQFGEAHRSLDALNRSLDGDQDEKADPEVVRILDQRTSGR
jgi:P27 family predicted phage terminase small subunit